jgi:hypothetical protein
MEKHFAQKAEFEFTEGLAAFSRLVDLVRAASLLGMYLYWTAQFHKVSHLITLIASLKGFSLAILL